MKFILKWFARIKELSNMRFDWEELIILICICFHCSVAGCHNQMHPPCAFWQLPLGKLRFTHTIATLSQSGGLFWCGSNFVVIFALGLWYVIISDVGVGLNLLFACTHKHRDLDIFVCVCAYVGWLISRRLMM